MLRISFAAWLALGLSAAQAAPITGPCWGDIISDTNGSQISLHSGQAYEAYPGPQPDFSLWLPMDKVTVCHIGGDAVQITDLDQKNREVKALRIYSPNSGEI